jgi:hypothetical protein
VHQNIRSLVAAPAADFSPLRSPRPTQARTQEINKGRPESRSLRTAALTGMQIGFPLAEQGALLLRQVQGRKDERVALVTSLVNSTFPRP